MLSLKFFMAAFLTFLLAAIVGGVTASQTIGTEEVNVLSTLMSFNLVDIDWSGWTVWDPIPHITFPWVSSIWTAFMFDYPIFDGTYGQYIKWGIWGYLSLPIILGLGMWIASLIRGN